MYSMYVIAFRIYFFGNAFILRHSKFTYILIFFEITLCSQLVGQLSRFSSSNEQRGIGIIDFVVVTDFAVDDIFLNRKL